MCPRIISSSLCIPFISIIVNALFVGLVVSKPYELSSISDFYNLLKTEKFVYVLFQASECRSCSQAIFSWELLEEKISKLHINVTIAQVDCSIHRDICSSENVKELPSIQLYVRVDQFAKLMYRYLSNEYDLISLEDFLIEKVKFHNNEEKKSDSGFSILLKPNQGLYELTDDDSSLFLNQGQHFVNFYAPWCLHCQNLKPKWELIAKSLENSERVKISQIDCSTNIYTCKVQFKIKEYPTLLWISNGKVIAKYRGSHELENIKAFINSQLIDFELTKLLKKIASSDGIEELEIDYRKKNSNVRILNNDNFKSVVESGYTFVHFTVPWSKHCRQIKSDWDKLSLRMPNIKIAKVDCSINEKLCTQEKIDSYPTLYLFHDGKRSAEYDGPRSVDLFEKYLNEQLKMEPNKDEF